MAESAPRALIVRTEEVTTENLIRLAQTIANQDPSWGTQVFSVSDGCAVLCGAGLYVNALFGLSLDLGKSVNPNDLDEFEQRSAAMGLPASIETGSATHPDVAEMIAKRGYLPSSKVDAFAIDLAGAGTTKVETDAVEASANLLIRPANGELLGLWQETSARGWGHTSPAARRASDAFGAAAAIVDGPGLLIARDATDLRPVACASVTIHGGVATLGGMSTLPNERRRGVQRALIAHRLGLARSHGCDLAYTTAATGGDSARNLARHGFKFLHTKTTNTKTANTKTANTKTANTLAL